MRSPRVSRARGRGERVVRICRGVVTQLQRDGLVSRKDGSPGEVLGVLASSRTSRRTAFARRRISATSCPRLEVAREGTPGRWRYRFVGEHGRGRVHSLSKYILEGVR